MLLSCCCLGCSRSGKHVNHMADIVAFAPADYPSADGAYQDHVPEKFSPDIEVMNGSLELVSRSNSELRGFCPRCIPCRVNAEIDDRGFCLQSEFLQQSDPG